MLKLQCNDWKNTNYSFFHASLEEHWFKLWVSSSWILIIYDNPSEGGWDDINIKTRRLNWMSLLYYSLFPILTFHLINCEMQEIRITMAWRDANVICLVGNILRYMSHVLCCDRYNKGSHSHHKQQDKLRMTIKYMDNRTLSIEGNKLAFLIQTC